MEGFVGIVEVGLMLVEIARIKSSRGGRLGFPPLNWTRLNSTGMGVERNTPQTREIATLELE